MLTHINLIRNVGQFDSVCAGANIPFQKFTVVYGENGRGKTTISAILKSLARNDPGLVEERQRLGAQDSPHIVLTSTTGQHLYRGGAWSVAHDKIGVFDDAFVSQNICSGIEIASDHRKTFTC